MESGSKQEQAWHRWLMSGVLALAAGLRSYQLDRNGLSANELPSLMACAPGVDSGFYSAFTGMTGYPPAFPLLLCRYLSLLGHSDLAARSFSVLAGVLLVALAYHVGRRLFSPSAGVLAAAMLAMDHHGIATDRLAGVYSLLALCLAAAGYCFCRLAQAPAAPATWQFRTAHSAWQWTWQPPAACDGRYLLGFWCAAILAFYTSVVAIGFYLAVLLLLPFWWRGRRDVQWAIAAPLLVAVLSWVPVLWGYSNWVMDGNLFSLGAWPQWPARLLSLLSPIPGAYGFQSSLLGLAVVLLPVGILKKWYDPGQMDALLLTATLSVLSLVALLTIPSISPVSLRGVVFFIVVMQAGIICQLLTKLRSVSRQNLATTLLVAVVVYCMFSRSSMQWLYFSEPQEDFRGAASIIASDAEFRAARGRIYLSDPRFSVYLQQQGFSASDFLDASRSAPPSLPFYFLEYFPGDPAAVRQAAPGLSADSYRPVCRTVLPWIRLSKFAEGPAGQSSAEPVDCRQAAEGL